MGAHCGKQELADKGERKDHLKTDGYTKTQRCRKDDTGLWKCCEALCTNLA